MFKPLVRLVLASALALSAGGLVPQMAEANVRTTTVGAALCRVNPDVGRDTGSVDNYGGGGAYWLSHNSNVDIPDVNLAVHCPVVRRLPLRTDGLSDFEIRFRGNPNRTTQVQCSVQSMRADGTIQLQEGSGFVTVAANALYTMDLKDVINVSSSKGAYNVNCLMPFNTEILTVYHSELDGIDGN